MTKTKTNTGNTHSKTDKRTRAKQNIRISRAERNKKNTREFPGLVLVDVHVADHGGLDPAAADLALKVIQHELLVSRMEAKPWRPALGVP